MVIMYPKTDFVDIPLYPIISRPVVIAWLSVTINDIENQARNKNKLQKYHHTTLNIYEDLPT